MEILIFAVGLIIGYIGGAVTAIRICKKEIEIGSNVLRHSAQETESQASSQGPY